MVWVDPEKWHMIEVRGGVTRLDLRCTTCRVYVGERVYAEPTEDGATWPTLGQLIRQASAHRCGENDQESRENRATTIDGDR